MSLSVNASEGEKAFKKIQTHKSNKIKNKLPILQALSSQVGLLKAAKERSPLDLSLEFGMSSSAPPEDLWLRTSSYEFNISAIACGQT